MKGKNVSYITYAMELYATYNEIECHLMTFYRRYLETVNALVILLLHSGH